MRLRKQSVDPEKRAQVLADALKSKAGREQGYRERALRLFPHLCGRCGREFTGARISELTVHHKDNDHNNNPPAGSHWELLCRACHDREHHDVDALANEAEAPANSSSGGLGFEAFAKLKDLLPDVGESTDPK
ncbi:MAG: HNH nuclease family protein [Candidatus Hydrogenedentes bacterium]|nr:HNH nuclease family protein [Candidatus Hydrogenedentota bacterium]